MFSPTEILNQYLADLNAIDAAARAGSDVNFVVDNSRSAIGAPAIRAQMARNLQVARDHLNTLSNNSFLSLLVGAHFPMSQPAISNPPSTEPPEWRMFRFNNLPHRKVGDDENMDQKFETCPICLEKPKEGEKVVQLLCLHDIHSACAWQWLKEHNTCPVCRFETL